MSKIVIVELDKIVNKGKLISLDKAMKNVSKYIIKNIDNTFCYKSFEQWLESGDDHPFKWGKNYYHWEAKTKH